MRTEDDLRDALRLFADRTAEVTAEPELHRAPRRRVLIAAAVVAAVVAAIIVVPQVIRQDPPKPPVAPPPYGWQPFSVDLPTGWRRVTTELESTASTAGISGADGDCSIVVYKTGAFDPATIGAPNEPITVNGHNGWAGMSAPEPGTWRRDRRGTAFWEYAPGGWARVSCYTNEVEKPFGLGSPVDTMNRRIAAGVEPGNLPELRVPIAFGHVPDGYSVTTARWVEKVGQPGAIVNLTLTRAGQPNRPIEVMMEWPASGPTDNGERLVVDGRPARLDGPGYLRIWYDGFELQLIAEAANLPDPRSELLAMAEQMTVVDPRISADWLPAKVGL